MRVSRELEEALESLHDRLDPGERVPEKWDELPRELRDRLKVGLAGSADAQLDRGFAEFVHRFLAAYRREELEEVALSDY